MTLDKPDSALCRILLFMSLTNSVMLNHWSYWEAAMWSKTSVYSIGARECIKWRWGGIIFTPLSSLENEPDNLRRHLPLKIIKLPWNKTFGSVSIHNLFICLYKSSVFCRLCSNMLHQMGLTLILSSHTVSQLQPLQQLAVVKKQSVCVKRKERKLSDQVEVSIRASAVLRLAWHICRIASIRNKLTWCISFNLFFDSANCNIPNLLGQINLFSRPLWTNKR